MGVLVVAKGLSIEVFGSGSVMTRDERRGRTCPVVAARKNAVLFNKICRR